MKKINTKLAEERWVEYEKDKDIKVKVRLFPMSQSLFAPIDEEGMGKAAWIRFNYCLIDWKGLTDENDKEFICNEKNKKYLFDHILELMMWITSILNEDINPFV